MSINDDNLIIEALKLRYEVALEAYEQNLRNLQLSGDELNKCILALNVWSEKQIPLVQRITGYTESEEKNTHVQKNVQPTDLGKPIVYDSGASIKAKIVKVLQIHNRAMSKDEIANFIGKQENNTDIEKIKNSLSGDLHLLLDNKQIVKSKQKGVKMKGFFYGNPEWLISDEHWVPEHSPRIQKEINNLWE